MLERNKIIISFCRRYVLLCVGLFIMAFGVALSVKANLGTSPIASVPYVFSTMSVWSMGVITFVMQTLFVLIQIALLRKDFKPMQLLQLVVAVVFGYFTNITLKMVENLDVTNYLMQWGLCIISILVIAFGIFLEVKSNVAMPAGEGLVRVISDLTKREFGHIKIIFDITLVVVAIVASYLYFGELKGVREGTIVSAIFVGTMVRFYSKKIHLFNHF